VYGLKDSCTLLTPASKDKCRYQIVPILVPQTQTIL
jgi:hypothetical protein